MPIHYSKTSFVFQLGIFMKFLALFLPLTFFISCSGSNNKGAISPGNLDTDGTEKLVGYFESKCEDDAGVYSAQGIEFTESMMSFIKREYTNNTCSGSFIETDREDALLIEDFFQLTYATDNKYHVLFGHYPDDPEDIWNHLIYFESDDTLFIAQETRNRHQDWDGWSTDTRTSLFAADYTSGWKLHRK